MDEIIDRFRGDARQRAIRRSPEFGALFLYALERIRASAWHWLGYHFQFLPPHPVCEALITAVLDCDAQIAGLGRDFIDRVAAAGGRDRNEADYQTMLQVFAEVLCLRQAFSCLWPGLPEFEYEPVGRNGKRPELGVQCDGKRYLLEVKAPSLLAHQRARSQNGLQVPGRGISREMAQQMARGPVTLPRDNPIKDFLISAEAKFASFPEVPGANVLIIVWDDHIYEPLTVLTNEKSGLLTSNSYYRDGRGTPITFPHIDGVIAIRHLNYFQEGLAERPLPDRKGLFDFGQPGTLPNVFFPTPWGREVPDCLLAGFRAVDYRDDWLKRAAEYNCIDIVLWI